MTLTDAGPLYVVFNRKDPNHIRCLSALSQLLGPLLTTWPCLTEAMYLLGRDLGYPAQDELLAYITDGLLRIHVQSEEECSRIRMLMSQFRDSPMDLADASLVAAAETLGIQQVFTLDRHFYAYRMAGGQAFEVVP